MKIKIEGQLTIGKMLEILDSVHFNADKTMVRFEFGYCVPTQISSWRGIYSEAALGHDGGTYDLAHLSVSEFKRMLVESMGPVQQGWKGGDYIFTMDTPLHVDNRGNVSHTEIVAVKFNIKSDEVWLKTKIRNQY